MTPISIKGLEKSECVHKQENGAINPGSGRIRNSREKSPDGLGPGTTTLKPGCRACKRAMEKADAATSRHLQAQKAQPVRPCGRWNAQNQGGGRRRKTPQWTHESVPDRTGNGKRMGKVQTESDTRAYESPKSANVRMFRGKDNPLLQGRIRILVRTASAE